MKKININNDRNYRRGANYRYEFLRHNRGIQNKRKYYHCAYCGRIKKKNDITVDHLIPVNKVMKGHFRKYWRRRLRAKGISNVNDLKNLVPACRKCNSKKGTKTGFWIIRGTIGKHFAFWCVYKPIKWLIILWFIFYISKTSNLIAAPHLLNSFFQTIKNILLIRI